MSEKPKRYHLCMRLNQAEFYEQVETSLRSKGIAWEKLVLNGGGQVYRILESEYAKLETITGTKPPMKGFKFGEEVLPFLLVHSWHVWIISGGVTEEDGQWVSES